MSGLITRRGALLDAVAQQGVWWACVLAAARGAPGWGVAAAVALTAAHALLRPDRARVLRSAAAAGVFGAITDSASARAGALGFAGSPLLAPVWMIALWGAFGVSLTASLAWIARWPAVAQAAVGALAGPLAYAAGESLGAIRFPSSVPLALGAVALQWALGVPLIALAAGARGPRARLLPEVPA